MNFSRSPFDITKTLDRCRDRAASPTFGTLVVLVASRVAEALPAYLAACPGDTRLRYVFQASQEAHEGRGKAERLEAAFGALEAIRETLSDDTGEAAQLAVAAVEDFTEALWDDALWPGALLTADRAVAAWGQKVALATPTEPMHADAAAFGSPSPVRSQV